ncbi:MAG: hypothetical protein ACE5JJ_11000, partial [Nitrospinota bacterium]
RRSIVRPAENFWMVVLVEGERPATVPLLAKVRPVIERTLRRTKQTAAIEGWIAGLRKKARIEVDRKLLAQFKMR